MQWIEQTNINLPNNPPTVVLQINEFYIKCQENNFNLINNLLERERKNTQDFWIFKNTFVQTFTCFWIISPREGIGAVIPWKSVCYITIEAVNDSTVSQGKICYCERMRISLRFFVSQSSSPRSGDDRYSDNAKAHDNFPVLYITQWSAEQYPRCSTTPRKMAEYGKTLGAILHSLSYSNILEKITPAQDKAIASRYAIYLCVVKI